ncbi:MAG: sigma-70 family RNA polymerase sigma factor [archaeon]
MVNSPEVVEKLVNENIDYVKKLANKYPKARELFPDQFDDLVALGNIALYDAAEVWYGGIKFSTLVYQRVTFMFKKFFQEIERKIMKTDDDSRALSLDYEYTNGKKKIKLGELLNNSGKSPIETLTEEEFHNLLNEGMEKLKPLEKRVLHEHYFEGLTCWEISRGIFNSDTGRCHSKGFIGNVKLRAEKKLREFYLEKGYSD